MERYVSFGDTDAQVSDNYFDLVPSQPFDITIHSAGVLVGRLLTNPPYQFWGAPPGGAKASASETTLSVCRSCSAPTVVSSNVVYFVPAKQIRLPEPGIATEMSVAPTSVIRRTRSCAVVDAVLSETM